MRNNKLRRLHEWQNELHHEAAQVIASNLSGAKTIEELDARTATDSALHRDLVACVKSSVPGSNFAAFVQSYGVSERARSAPAEKVAQHIGTQLLTQLRNGIESNGNTIVGFLARKAGSNASIGGGLLQKFRATTAPTSSANFKDDKTMYLRIATQALGQAGHTNRVVHSVYRPKVDEPVGHHMQTRKKKHGHKKRYGHRHIKTACPLTVSRIVHGRYFDGTAAEMQVPVEEAEHMARRYHLFSGRVVQMDRDTPAVVGQEVAKKKKAPEEVAAGVQLVSTPQSGVRRSDTYQVRAPVFIPLLGAPIPNDGLRLSMPPLGAPIFAAPRVATKRVQSMMDVLKSGDLTI